MERRHQNYVKGCTTTIEKIMIPFPIEVVKSGAPEHKWDKYYRLKSGDIFVEAGAHFGRFGMIASMVGCKVILIEPSPINILTMENLISKEKLENIILVKKAVSKSKSIQDFIVYHNNPEANELASSQTSNQYSGKFPNNYSIKVETDTIDNILTELNIDNVDLLSADIEGAEVDMVKGMNVYLSEKRIKNVAIATYHGEQNPIEVSAMLREHGYKNIRTDEGVTYARVP